MGVIREVMVFIKSLGKKVTKPCEVRWKLEAQRERERGRKRERVCLFTWCF
jgi:hypothetical protein